MSMDEDAELELLLSLDGVSFEAAGGYVVECSARRTPRTRARPHGVDYALVLRPKAGGAPYVRFDNAHGVPHRGGKHMPRQATYDHWHRTENDLGWPYAFTTASQLLEDFWREVKRSLDEKGVPNDL
jgi:hypothetical protein